jgi:hypothetical protein
MATLDNLPDDQRAVLSLVLQRGRGYDEISRMLSIDRAAVRARALAAVDALGPRTGIPDQRRALITDYLLGQLPAPLAAETRDRLASSASERAWARVVASELAPIASGPLPEIPVGGAAAQPPADVPEPSAPARAPVAAASASAVAATAEAQAERDQVSTALGDPPPQPPEPRSSRTGGIILLAGGALLVIAAVVVVVILASSSSSSKPKAPVTAAAHSGTSSTSVSGTTSGSTTPTPVAALKLSPPDTKSNAAGFAEVVKVGTNHGIEIVAQHITPNTTKPPNAYAVWLYNSAGDAQLLGFVNPGVGKNGRLETAGGLPGNAGHFKHVIITLETKADPKTPGTIVLQGPLSGLS